MSFFNDLDRANGVNGWQRGFVIFPQAKVGNISRTVVVVGGSRRNEGEPILFIFFRIFTCPLRYLFRKLMERRNT